MAAARAAWLWPCGVMPYARPIGVVMRGLPQVGYDVCQSGRFFQTPYGFHKRRHDGLPIPYDAVARFTENVGVRVFVDGHNDLRTRAPGHVLARPGDAHRNIEIRGDRLPGQTNLPV